MPCGGRWRHAELMRASSSVAALPPARGLRREPPPRRTSKDWRISRAWRQSSCSSRSSSSLCLVSFAAHPSTRSLSQLARWGRWILTLLPVCSRSLLPGERGAPGLGLPHARFDGHGQRPGPGCEHRGHRVRAVRSAGVGHCGVSGRGAEAQGGLMAGRGQGAAPGGFTKQASANGSCDPCNCAP